MIQNAFRISLIFALVIHILILFPSVGLDCKGAMAKSLIANSEEPEQKIDCEALLLDLEDLDDGQYRAVVIQYPQDKRKVRGFFHIAKLMSPSMLEHGVSRTPSGRAKGVLLENELALKKIVEAMNSYTSIRTDFGKQVALADEELLKVPWITFTTGRSFYPNDKELKNLGRYLVAGGFLFIDAGSSIRGVCDVNRRDIVKRALKKAGKTCRFYRIYENHPIYHAYYNFDVVPTIGRGNNNTGRGALSSPEYLIGVNVGRRLAVVFSYVDIMSCINKPYYEVNNSSSKRLQTGVSNNQRLLQFMVNTIVFALTQEGSLAHRVMGANK